MRIFFLFCLCASVATAQVATDPPLRKLGTNVFDFAPLIQSVQRGEATNTPFLVMGDVSEVGENWAYVVRKKLEPQMSREFKENLMLAGPGEQLKMMYAEKVMEKWRQGKLEAGEFMALDPTAKRIVFDEIEREKKMYINVRMFVTNCPAKYLVRGKQVRFFAIPTGTHAVVDKAENAQSIPRFDYGQPVEKESGDFTNVVLVTARGIVKKESPQQIAAKKAATDAKLIGWHQQQATNNVAYAQYELGKRYLNGDSLERNEALGLYWLRRAATQDYEPALQLLKKRAEEPKP